MDDITRGDEMIVVLDDTVTARLSQRSKTAARYTHFCPFVEKILVDSTHRGVEDFGFTYPVITLADQRFYEQMRSSIQIYCGVVRMAQFTQSLALIDEFIAASGFAL